MMHFLILGGYMKKIDLHVDTLMLLSEQRDSSLLTNDFKIDLYKLKKADYLMQVFAVFVNPQDENYASKVLKMIQSFHQEIQKNSKLIAPIYQYRDIIKNMKLNKISALLSLESGLILYHSNTMLDVLYDLGIRILTLTWNEENSIGYSHLINEPLKCYGKKLISKLNSLGIAIDVSHLSDKGVLDVLKLSDKPIMASHSNVREICYHSRNLPLDIIKKINAKKGIIGLNFYPPFVSINKELAISDLISHINFLVKNDLLDVISIGTDFDGFSEETFIKDASMMDDLVSELYKAGYKTQMIEKIMYKNALRFLKSVLR